MTSHALKHQDLLITLAHGNFIGDATVCKSQHLKSVLKDLENIAYWWSHGKGECIKPARYLYFLWN